VKLPKPKTKAIALNILLGKTAREFRESLGLTQRAVAEQLGISFVHLCNVEKNRAIPSQALIDKYRAIWGIDLYVLAWCLHGDPKKLPEPLRRAASVLAAGWKKHIDKLIESQKAAEP
jgi:transcriptional regulator with XRE-family HTH domain